jgi:hypothetical protein
VPSTIELAPPSTFPKGASAYPCLPASLTSVGSLLVGVSVPVPVAAVQTLSPLRGISLPSCRVRDSCAEPTRTGGTHASGKLPRLGARTTYPGPRGRAARPRRSPRRAEGDLELPQARRDVVGDRPLGEKQPLRYVRVSQPLRDQFEHLYCTRGQVGGVLPRRGTRPPRQPPGAALAQTASDDRRRRPSAQAQPCSYRDCRAPPRAVRPARSIVPLLIRRSRGRARSPV